MSTNGANPNELLDKMLALRNEVHKRGRKFYKKWEPVIENVAFKSSALNLSHYLALRRTDIRDLQEELSSWGLSSLGRLESRTLDTIDAVIASLGKITGRDVTPIVHPPRASFTAGRDQLRANSEVLFGKNLEARKTRIMVTLPAQCADHYETVRELMERGMNVARINTAHDGPTTWMKMIENVRRAERELTKTCKVLMDIAGPKSRISWIFMSENKNRVNVGDEFLLTANDSVRADSEVRMVLACSIPEMLAYVKIGERVLIDDGVVEGKVEEICDGDLLVRIKKVQIPRGVRLRVDKGINFPDSDLDIDILTDKDKDDLDFICAHTDIIGFSFVKNAADIDFVLSEIAKRMPAEQFRRVPIIAKIETVSGVKNLPEIIMDCAGRHPFGVMIARGDLAVEAGYLRLAELQQEILWICEASDTPVVWATQVLDSMVSTGIPTRAEVTDAAEGGARAECVMLNKGDYLPDAITFLNKVLVRMERIQYKKTAKLRALNIAKDVF